MQDTKHIYTRRLNTFSTEAQQLKRKNYWVSASRLILFVSAIIFSFIFIDKNLKLVFLINIFALIPFLFLVTINVKYQKKIKLLNELISINKKEQAALEGDNSAFPAGKEYIDYEHPYSYDLDIFGEASLYQAINRSCTQGGADKLASFLQNPILDTEKIRQTQQAIKELSEKLNWRQNFQATGNAVLENNASENNTSTWFSVKNTNFNPDTSFHKEIIDWVNSEFYFSKIKILKFLLVLLPIGAVSSLVLTISGIFPFMGLVLVVLTMLSVVGYFNKKIMNVHAKIGRKVNILDKYEKLLKLIEKEPFNSDLLNRLFAKTQSDNKKASAEVQKLKKLAKALDNRLNLVFALFANGFLLWDLQVVLRMEKWRKQNRKNINNWFESIYTFDALNGFANFAYNHPHFTLPEIKTGNFYLKMEQSGHPLLKDDVRVNTDFIIDDFAQIRIITGANMAGKSTFLRTVGVNMVLAMSGSVVCAQKFVLSPISLHTSVRTNDSLQKHESYFFAELKRLKSIIERLESGEKLFVIIDEMLRGTNSKDKHLGSAALIERLIKLQASGLIATHDIELGKMTEKYPENIKNYRFEVAIQNNELFFDYKIKSGISQNLNAMFLMKKMGIVE
ncbi:MAG: hypothetical protein L3J74_04920 [Bacteroidales bacterium]|nr:hypothetical protein [Bacteroidales bacterium]